MSKKERRDELLEEVLSEIVSVLHSDRVIGDGSYSDLSNKLASIESLRLGGEE